MSLEHSNGASLFDNGIGLNARVVFLLFVTVPNSLSCSMLSEKHTPSLPYSRPHHKFAEQLKPLPQTQSVSITQTLAASVGLQGVGSSTTQGTGSGIGSGSRFVPMQEFGSSGTQGIGIATAKAAIALTVSIYFFQDRQNKLTEKNGGDGELHSVQGVLVVGFEE